MVAIVGPATTQNLVVKFDGEICGGVLVEISSDDFPSKRSAKISFQTSPEVRHQFRRKLRQLHCGNRWCLQLVLLLNMCCYGEALWRGVGEALPGNEAQTSTETDTPMKPSICGCLSSTLARERKMPIRETMGVT